MLGKSPLKLLYSRALSRRNQCLAAGFVEDRTLALLGNHGSSLVYYSIMATYEPWWADERSAV